jgi:hypothetical protein
MNSIRSRILVGIVGIASCISSTNLSAAVPALEGKELTPRLKSGAPEVVVSPGKKGGGGQPAPPADPQCPIGSSSVGPIDHSTFNRACSVKGKPGVQSCYRKMVQCLGGPGEPQSASTESCGPCVASPTQPGQTQSPTGR